MPCACMRSIDDHTYAYTYTAPVGKKVLDLLVTHPAPDAAGKGVDATTRGTAAKRGEVKKRRSYCLDFMITEADVIPMVLETHGCMGESLQRLVKDLADLAVPVAWVLDPSTGKERPVDYDAIRALHIRGVRERVSVALQKENAWILRGWAHDCFVPAPPVGADEQAAA